VATVALLVHLRAHLEALEALADTTTALVREVSTAPVLPAAAQEDVVVAARVRALFARTKVAGAATARMARQAPTEFLE
jgi:hypothetical protein